MHTEIAEKFQVNELNFLHTFSHEELVYDSINIYYNKGSKNYEIPQVLGRTKLFSYHAAAITFNGFIRVRYDDNVLRPKITKPDKLEYYRPSWLTYKKMNNSEKIKDYKKLSSMSLSFESKTKSKTI